MTAPGAPDTPDTEARGRFSVAVADVVGLVPNVRIKVPGGEQDEGRSPITNDRIVSWINMVTGTVGARIANAVRITDQPKLTVIQDAGFAIVANGAAAYLAGAAAPEQDSLADTTNEQVLWRRYGEGLDALAATIDQWIDDGTATGDTGGGAAWSFPCVTIPDRNPYYPSW